MSARYNPFEELQRFFDQLSSQFDDPRLREAVGPMGVSLGEPMAIDLVEHDDEFVATVDLPGFERDDVAVRVSNHTLRIHAERAAESEESDEQYIRRERSHEAASRSLTLPEEVATENVQASMKHGVLTVRMPRIDIDEARTIEIE